MLTAHEGYAAAARIDKAIDEVLQAHDIDEAGNYAGYCTLLRTIRTTLDILERTAGQHAPRCPECGKTD